MSGYGGSEVDFTQGIYRELARPLQGHALCSYLVALAAWQRGLKVAFWGSQAAARVTAPAMARTTTKPGFLTVSDGRVTHAFERSRGDLSSQAAVRQANDKAETKRLLVAAGVPTPLGLFYDRKRGAEAERFLAQSKAAHFVLKPNNGSLAIGVTTRLTRAQVPTVLDGPNYDRAVLEEFITGTEYRVHAVGDRAVHGYTKTGVFVIGNGLATIGQLIQQKNKRRAEIPGYEVSPIDPAKALQLLRLYGRDLTTVPVLGERVELSTIGNISMGGEAVGQASLPPAVAEAAVGATRAVGLPNAGVDIIYDGTTAYVLEVNPTAFLRAHSFVSAGVSGGNAVAEAIVDLYFPAPDIRRRNLPLDPGPILAEFAAKGTRAHYPLPEV